ncbi:MAG: hypothetical protein FWC23_05085 [Chitinispirillia bacterium]|nr:hypothetical protein [Chitinispirillia bacterium]
MKNRVLSLAAAGCLLITGAAWADQCAWINEVQAARAQAILAERPMVLEHCEPCAEKGAGTPYAVDTVGVTTPGEGYREISINGKNIDLAYIFVRVSPGRYDNFAFLVGCEATDVSESLSIPEEVGLDANAPEPAESDADAGEADLVIEMPKADDAHDHAGLTAEFVSSSGRRTVGTVNFFRQGGKIERTILRVFDSRGNLVKRININDRARRGEREKRIVGAWDLTNMNSRLVRPGKYTVKGTIAARDGKGDEEVLLTIDIR